MAITHTVPTAWWSLLSPVHSMPCVSLLQCVRRPAVATAMHLFVGFEHDCTICRKREIGMALSRRPQLVFYVLGSARNECLYASGLMHACICKGVG